MLLLIFFFLQEFCGAVTIIKGGGSWQPVETIQVVCAGKHVDWVLLQMSKQHLPDFELCESPKVYTRYKQAVFKQWWSSFKQQWARIKPIKSQFASHTK